MVPITLSQQHGLFLHCATCSIYSMQNYWYFTWIDYIFPWIACFSLPFLPSCSSFVSFVPDLAVCCAFSCLVHSWWNIVMNSHIQIPCKFCACFVFSFHELIISSIFASCSVSSGFPVNVNTVNGVIYVVDAKGSIVGRWICFQLHLTVNACWPLSFIISAKKMNGLDDSIFGRWILFFSSVCSVFCKSMTQRNFAHDNVTWREK